MSWNIALALERDRNISGTYSIDGQEKFITLATQNTTPRNIPLSGPLLPRVKGLTKLFIRHSN
jgi:hypothetical protein